MRILVASGTGVVTVDPERGDAERARGLERHDPTCLAVAPDGSGRAWCGTGDGVLASDEAGRSWSRSGLEGEHVTALAACPAGPETVWAGTEPSALWRSEDGGATWRRAEGLGKLPSSARWSFPPKPETHHVRWIACHPARPGHLRLAIEAGALVTTPDGGRTWEDRVPGGPRDTHELAIHPGRPETLRIAAGDGYFESHDGGATWSRPRDGLEVGYLRSVAIDPGDPDAVVASASSRARSAYVTGHADGRVYRRTGGGSWQRVLEGWPEPPDTIAPLLRPGLDDGELWAADERGVHRSEDGGRSWARAARFPRRPSHLRGFAVVPPPGGRR